MQTGENSRPEVITAKWKTAISAKEEMFGTIALDEGLELRFPMLDASDAIPVGTKVVWGITDRLKRCTAMTLPFRPPGRLANLADGAPTERLYFTRGHIIYLLAGREYIADPAGEFVSGVTLTPQPNEDLHTSTFDVANPNLADLLEAEIPSTEAKVRATLTPRTFSPFAQASAWLALAMSRRPAAVCFGAGPFFVTVTSFRRIVPGSEQATASDCACRPPKDPTSRSWH